MKPVEEAAGFWASAGLAPAAGAMRMYWAGLPSVASSTLRKTPMPIGS